MKKYLKYGFIVAFVVVAIAAIWYIVNPSTPTIKSDVFTVEEWNTPEYIASNTHTIHDGTVVKEMKSDDPNLYDCIIECKSNTGNGTYLIYYVDTVKHSVGENMPEFTGVWIAHYNYEESIDMVRKLPVYISMSGIEYLQNK